MQTRPLCIALYTISVRQTGSLPASVLLNLRIRLPLDSTSRWTPLPSANTSYCQACSGLSPPSCRPSRAHKINVGTVYRAALFCRLSKDDDGNKGESSSIQTQRDILENYCRQQGFLVHDFYVDEGYSGLNYDRPNFQRMLNDIDSKKVNLVITKDLSRLGRDYIQTGYYTEIYFQNKQVRYIAVNDGYDSNLDNNDIAPFRHILNDMYARDLSRKVKSAKRQAYDSSGTKWAWETVQIILKNRVYMGDMENHKSEKFSYKLKKYVIIPPEQRIVVENTHEAIISREDWNKVQQLVSARHRKTHNNFKNLFRGTVYCLDCGWKLNMQSKRQKNGNVHHTYRCDGHYRHPEKCPKPRQITYRNVYSLVLERVQKLANLMRNDDGLMKLIRQKSSGDSKADKLVSEKSKVEKRLNELSRLLRKLFEDNAKGLLDDRNYEVMMGEYQTEQASLNGKLAKIQSQLAENEDYAGQLEKLQEAVNDCLDIEELTPLVLNKLIDRIEVISQEVVDGQRQQVVRIVWNFTGEV